MTGEALSKLLLSKGRRQLNTDVGYCALSSELSVNSVLPHTPKPTTLFSSCCKFSLEKELQKTNFKNIVLVL